MGHARGMALKTSLHRLKSCVGVASLAGCGRGLRVEGEGGGAGFSGVARGFAMAPVADDDEGTELDEAPVVVPCVVAEGRGAALTACGP